MFFLLQLFQKVSLALMYKYLLVCSYFVSYPIEVIRNGLQSSRTYEEQKLGISKLARIIYKERGLKGFYYGYNVALIRILPSNAVMFCTYEFISRLLIQYYNKESKV